MQFVLLIVGLLVIWTTPGWGWRARQEYKFVLEGRTLTGIPSMKHQYSGIHFAGGLRVQVESPEILLMKVQNMTFTKIHKQLPRGWWQTLPDDDESFQYQNFPMSNSPFIARINKGKIERLVVSGNLPSWVVNLMQSIVAHLQLDLSGSDSVKHGKSKSNRIPGGEHDADVYTVMESSLVGKCEVMYEIAPISKSEVLSIQPEWETLCGKNRDYLSITKTRNYSRCSHIAESHFGLPHTVACSPGGNQCGSFWTRTSVSRTIGCGDRRDLILLNTVSSSRILSALRLAPDDTSRGHPANHAAASTYVNLTLLSAKPFGSRRFGQPTNPINIDGLRFQYDVANVKHGTSWQRNAESSTSNEHTRDQSSSNEREEREPPRYHRKRPSKRSVSNNADNHRHYTSGASEEAARQTKSKRTGARGSSERSNVSANSNENSSGEQRNDNQNDSMAQPPLLPFSAFTLAHREGEARSCLVQQMKEMINDITNDLEMPDVFPEKMTLEKIQIAVQICRTMSYSELNQAVHSILDGRKRDTQTEVTEKKLLEDIITMCGTNPAFKLIKYWLTQRKIRGEAAAEIFASLPSYLLTPSSDVVGQYFDLVRSTASSEEQQVKIASILSFSHLLRAACFSKSVRKMRYSEAFTPCSSKSTATYIPYLTSQMRADPSLRRVYISALGNTGAPNALPILLHVARDSSASPYQRASAILAAKYQFFQEPSSAVYTLLSFFNNPKNPTPVRVAALSILFYSRLPLTVWQRIAINTWYEQNEAINSYIWSTINNLATLQDPFYAEMSQNAQAVLPLARPMPLGSHRAYNLVRTAVTSGLRQVILEQLSWSADTEAANVYYRHTNRLGGFSRLSFEADAWLMDADGFLTSLAEILHNPKKPEILRPKISNLQRSTHWIRETLKIATRELPRMEGSFGFKLSDYHERMFPIDPKKLFPMFEKIGNSIEQLRGSKQFYQKIGETGFWISVPSELGFPIEQRVSVPWIIRAHADFKGPREQNSLTAEAKLSFASHLVSELSVYTPFDCMQYVAGSKSHTFMQLPAIRLTTRWGTSSKPQLEVAVNSLVPDKEMVVFSQHSRPYTSQYDALSLAPLSSSKTTMTINIAPIVHTELLPGSPIPIMYSSEAPNHRWSPEPHWVLSYLTLWPGLEAASLELVMARSWPVSMLFTFGRAKTENNKFTMTLEPMMSHMATNASKKDFPFFSWGTTSTTEKPDTSMSGRTTTGKPMDMYISMENTVESEPSILSTQVNDPIGNFNASAIRLLNLQANSTRPIYLLKKVLEGINSGEAYVLGADVSFNNSYRPTYQFFWTLSKSRSDVVHRAGLFIIDDKQRWQLGATAIQQYPQAPVILLRSILEANLTSNFSVDFNYISNKSEHIVSIKGNLLRTESQTEKLRNNSMVIECLRHGLHMQPECRELGIEAGFLDRYNVTISYNDNAHTNAGSISHYLHILKQELSHYLAEQEIESIYDSGSTAHATRVVAELNPEEHTAAMWVRASQVETELNDVPISAMAMQALRLNAITGFMPYIQEPSFCSLENERIITFDALRYIYSMGDCWHVVTKDCSGRSRVVILARYRNNYTELEVNLDNHKIIRLVGTGRALINDRMIELEDDQLAEAYDQAGTRLFELSTTRDNAQQLILPAHGFTILHANDTLLIKAKPTLRGRLCGLCGDFNGEKDSDFRDPGNNLLLSASDFARSYALPSSSCQLQR